MMAQSNMTAAEAERLRELLSLHDQANGGKKDKEFDLSDPPRVISSGGTQQSEQYRHQEYPLHMTKPRKGKADVTKVARNAAEAADLVEKGYLDPEQYRSHVASLPKPVDPEDEDEEALTEEEIRAQIEASGGEFDPNAPAPKNRGGRPRKNFD